MAEACKEMGCLISNSAAEGDGELWVLIEEPSALVDQVHKLPRRVEPAIKNSRHHILCITKQRKLQQNLIMFRTPFASAT